jgi:hypothetical protein
VQSEQGKGSCFTVSIRLEPAEPVGADVVLGQTAQEPQLDSRKQETGQDSRQQEPIQDSR